MQKNYLYIKKSSNKLLNKTDAYTNGMITKFNTLVKPLEIDAGIYDQTKRLSNDSLFVIHL